MAYTKFINEPAKEIPVTGHWNVVVCGGGIAGVAAALAAKRSGAEKVLLIEKLFQLGGLATSGLVTIYLPLCDGEGNQISYGLAEELLRLSIKHGHEAQRPTAWLEDLSLEEKLVQRYRVRFNASMFAVLSEKQLREEGVDILYGTVACGVSKCDECGKITALFLESKSGRTAIEVDSVIDATGDADICKLAEENTEDFTQGNIIASWYYSHVGNEFRLNKLGFADVPDKYKNEESDIKAKGEIDTKARRYDGRDAFELSEMMQDAHASILNHFLGEGEISDEYAIATMATTPQIRMTRRMNGDYVMNDSEMHKKFADSVGMFSDWRKAGPAYELPFGTLHGSKVKNLLSAGRCISVTEDMWDITRTIPVCAVSGEAAGTAAAMTSDFTSIDIAALQAELVRKGVKIHR